MSGKSIIALALLAPLSACGDQTATNNGSEAPAPVDVQALPPAESDFNEDVPAADPTQVANSTTAAAPIDATMPPAIRGRWALKPSDCAPGDEGLITVSSDSIQFYESVAKPIDVRTRSSDAIAGDFSFSGEGQTWESPMSWRVAGDRLTRIDSEAESRLVYRRCP